MSAIGKLKKITIGYFMLFFLPFPDSSFHSLFDSNFINGSGAICSFPFTFIGAFD